MRASYHIPPQGLISHHLIKNLLKNLKNKKWKIDVGEKGITGTLVYNIYWHILETLTEKTETLREREMEAVVAANPIIKVAALCGSLRKASYNRGLIRSGTLFFLSFSTLFLGNGFWLCMYLIICSNRAEQVHQWLANRVHRHSTFAYAQHWFRRRRNFPTSRGIFPPEN